MCLTLWNVSHLTFLACSNMAEASTSCGTQTTSASKRIPEMFSDLLDLAIFSFACQSGLKSNHKIRGDPVLEGVAAFLGRLVTSSNAETMAEFNHLSPSRLGNWKPGDQPTKELLTLISSRMKATKTKGLIKEKATPMAPSLLVHKVERFSEVEDRVKTSLHPKCWRCSTRCQFCVARKKYFPKFGNFNLE